MKSILVGLCFCFCAIISRAQTLEVLDSKTKDPLGYTAIYTKDLNQKIYTDFDGKADISKLKDSNEIFIKFIGYRTEVYSYSQLDSMQFSVLLELKGVALDQVVISATRWEQNTVEIPTKITPITKEEVALQNPQTAADLLALSGEVFIQKSQQGGGSPVIRGFATNRLLYSVDGVRMNTAIFRSGNLQNVISLDPFAMESTEVLFGPSSVIYGSDAIGGVMSFQTLNPTLSDSVKPLLQGNVTGRYASANNERTGHFDVNIGWKKWAILTSVSSNDFDDLKMGSHGPDDYLNEQYVIRQDSTDIVVSNEDPRVQRPSAYSQINLMQKVRFKPNEKMDIVYGFHYSETSDYGRYDRHLRHRNGAPRYAEWNYGPQKWMMNNLSLNLSDSTIVFDELSFRIAHQYFEESRIDRDFNDELRTMRIEKVDAYSTNLDMIKKVGTKHKLFYGIEYILNNVRSIGEIENITTGFTSPGPSRYPEATWQSIGIYISDQYNPSEKVAIHSGLRYNQFYIDASFDTSFYPIPYTGAQIQNDALTGSIGIAYHPNEDWLFSSNIATAFRSPNVDDIGKVFDSEPGAVVVPNPDLGAEYAYNFDIGIAKDIRDKVKLDATAYYTILENALVRRDYTIAGHYSIVYQGVNSKVQAIQNAARAHVYGIQAGIEVKLPSGFGFITDFNYQNGEEEMDDGSTTTSRHAPPWFGVTRLMYVKNKVNLQVYAMYSGERSFQDLNFGERRKTEIYAADENGQPYSPAWYTLNFKGIYKVNETIRFSCGLENITDRRYRPYSSGISAAGRNFILSASCRF